MAAVSLLYLFSIVTFAQQPSNPGVPADLPVFRAGTSLALVRFHVVKSNRYVDTIKPQDLVLMEDGEPRTITFFEGGRLSKQRTVPLELTLLFDISGSVTQEGLLDFVIYKSSILDVLPAVKLSVYGFDGSLKRFCRPTRDPAILAEAFRRIQNYRGGAKLRPDTIKLTLPPKRKSRSGGTLIFESVLAAAKDAATTTGEATRMILVFSDGFATTDTRPRDVTGELNDMGIAVYPVLLGHQKIKDRVRHIMESGRNQQGMLSDGAKNQLAHIELQEKDIMDYASLGELTGGRSFDPPLFNFTTVRDILTSMAHVVRFEYVLGFRPEDPDGKPRKHKLSVKLQSKELGKVTGGTRVIVH